MIFPLTPIVVKLFELAWEKSLNDLKTIAELHDESVVQNVHTRELLELRLAKFCIRREALKERKTRAYILYGTEVGSFFGRPVKLNTIFNLLVSLSVIVMLVFIYSCFPLNSLWENIMLVGASYLGISIFQFALYMVTLVLETNSFRGSRKPLSSYSAVLRKADKSPITLTVKCLEDRTDESYPFLGRPFLDEMHIYSRKLDKKGESESPVIYEFVSSRKLTLLEIEWGLKLNRLGTFANRVRSYIPFVEEDWGITPSAYYLVLPESDYVGCVG